MKVPSVRDLDVRGKRVFLRADLNVPAKDGRVKDDTRITATLPTLRHLLEGGGRVVVASHLGRPKGGPDPKYSLAPVAKRLGELLGREVPLAPAAIGAEVEQRVGALQPGEVLLLENVRFDPREEKNDPAFSRALAALADVYVNDAFGTMHRAHSSTAGLAALVGARAAGFLVERELDALGRLRDGEVERPYLAILGGAKVSDKIPVLEKLVTQVDALVVGGAMAYTFLRAQGVDVGGSRVEADQLDLVRRLVNEAGARGVTIHLPSDHVVNAALDATAAPETTAGAAIPADRMGLDIGPVTADAYEKVIGEARTIFWNGPMGVFEDARYAEGTMRVARAVAASTGFTVVGGGDSVAAVGQAGLTSRIGHVSTGGGASLEFLAGDELPGVAALGGA